MIDYLLQNKKLSVRVAIGIVIITVLSILWTNVIRTPAYLVIVDGKKAFVVKHKSDVEEALLSLQEQQAEQIKSKLELGNQIDYRRTFASRGDVISGMSWKRPCAKRSISRCWLVP